MPKQFLNIDNFGKGINNVKNPRDLAIGEMADCQNWNVSKNGELVPRSEWHTNNDGDSLRLNSNFVDNFTASLNPGYGLHYFEADDSIGVRGVSITATGGTGTIADGPDGSGHYVLCFYDGNKIFINDDNFWTTNNVIPGTSSTDFPVKILISGAEESSNNGIFTIQSVDTILATVIIQAEGALEMGVDMTYSVLNLVETTLTTENVADDRVVTIKRLGFVGDAFLAVGNTNDGKVDIYVDSDDSISTDAISVLNVADGSEVSEFVYYYADGVLRVADGNFKNESTPKWYGFIERDQFYYRESGTGGNDFTSRSVETQFHEETNDLASPTSANFTASGSVDGSAEFPTAGAGWGLSVISGGDKGDWEEKTYEFACTFIYDGNQESLLTTFDATFDATEGKKLVFNVYAKHAGSNNYPDRVSGGRIYIREDGSNDEWTLLADMDIKSGVRATLEDEYFPWYEEAHTDATCDYNNDPTITHDDDDGIITVGMKVSGTGIPAGAYVLSVTNDTTFELSASTTGGSVTDGTLTFQKSSGKFRITNSATKANRGTTYWRLKSSKPNLDTYETLNGFPPSTKQIAFGQQGAGYKTAVVAGRRAFVANVKYDEDNIGSSDGVTEFQHFGDRIMYSEIGKFDTFPSHNFIDVVKGDGEDYVKLSFYGDRVLAFKQRTLQILNIASPSPSNWFLEKTVPYAGTLRPYSVCDTEYGVLWANKNGAYLYDGTNVTNLIENKIADSGISSNSSTSWSSFSGVYKIVVGYIPETKQAIFIDRPDSAGQAFYYDFRYKSWYYGSNAAPNKNNSAITNGSSFTPSISNMINDSNGKLIIAYDTQGTSLGDAGANKVVCTYHQTGEVAHKVYLLQTPDLHFNEPGKTKKVYAIYINYRHSGSTAINDSEVEYMTNNSGTWVVFNDSSVTIPQTHSSNKNYSTIKLRPSSTPISCQSIAFRFNFDALNEDSKFAINDIVVEYRVLTKKAA